MRRSSEPEERAQFSVAELVARYGEPTPNTGRRRRRAAADDTGVGVDTAVQPPVEPIRTTRTDPGGGAPPLAAPSSHHGPSQRYSSLSSGNGGGGRQWAPAVETPAVRTTPVRTPAVQSTAVRTPPGGTPAVGTSAVGRPSVIAGHRSLSSLSPLSATVLSGDPATVQFPRVAPAPTDPAPWSGRPPGGGEPPAGLGNATRAIPAQKANGRRVDERPRQAWKATEEARDADPGRNKSSSDKLHGDEAANHEAPNHEPHSDEVHSDEVHSEESEYGSPVREWAVMVAQIGIGIVGGAALWLICEWLWQRMPVVALIVALAVITGLVWVVRRVRRADDLQTTVIAVLVGLFVTVSPAALLLVGGR